MVDRNTHGRFIEGHPKVGLCGVPKGTRNSIPTEFKKGLIPWNKTEHLILVCQYCGKEFDVCPCDSDRKFCSHECGYKGKTHEGYFVKGHESTFAGQPKSIFFFKGRSHSEESKRKQSEAHKGKKLTREHIRNCLRRRPMSSLEVKFDGIIKGLNLPYKFVGNGDFFIERKNPDFVNTNGQKIAIEVYNRKHKNLFRGGIEQWQTERNNIFTQYGWGIIYFDETEVNPETVLSKLGVSH